jgi:post-segregation antitoxin (ccd killing protein)
MARLNVYVPDDLAARSREAGLNVSALTQAAIAGALAAVQTDSWLATLPAHRGDGATIDDVLAALDGARDDFGVRG